MLQKFTYKVNLIKDLLSYDSPYEDIEALVKTMTIWLPYMDYPVRHGDIIELYGEQGYNLQKYIDSGATSSLEPIDPDWFIHTDIDKRFASIDCRMPWRCFKFPKNNEVDERSVAASQYVL